MTDFLLQIAATKLVLSIALAAVVWVVQKRVTRPAIVHTLWLLVLGTLLIPAVVPLRVLPEQAEAEMIAMPRSLRRRNPRPLSLGELKAS